MVYPLMRVYFCANGIISETSKSLELKLRVDFHDDNVIRMLPYFILF